MIATIATTIARDLIGQLAPCCDQIEIAGSLRRRRPHVNDLDLVVRHPRQGPFLTLLMELYGRRPDVLGAKYLCLSQYRGIQVDCYLADALTWPTVLLIRTGSKEHNIALCQKARQLGMRLHADGRGIERDGRILAPQSEAEIFEALGLPYKEPWDREA